MLMNIYIFEHQLALYTLGSTFYFFTTIGYSLIRFILSRYKHANTKYLESNKQALSQVRCGFMGKLLCCGVTVTHVCSWV